jgi:hypothetical protein
VNRTTWAMFGSLVINLMLGLVVAAVFSVAPSARAGEPGHCTHAVQPKRAPERVAPPATRRAAYLVEARMGWGPAG